MYFPFFIDIEGKKCVIIGGGKTALRKARVLYDFKADITVVAPEILDGFSELKNIRLLHRCFEKDDVDGAFMVICACDKSEVNSLAADEAQKRGILTDVVDDKEKCSFIFPAIVKKGDVVSGISSGGKSPLVCRFVKEKLEESLPENIGEINDRMYELRSAAKEKIADANERQAALKTAFFAMLENGSISREELFEIIGGWEKRNAQN